MTKSNAQKAFEKIKKAQLKPRSALSMLAEQLGYAALFGVVFIGLVLAINWIGFWLRVTGNAVFLDHGPLGIGAFLLGFPLSLIFLALLAFGLTIILLRHYDISYKQPILLLALGLLVGAILLGGGLAKTGINERIAERVEEGRLAPLRPIYGGKNGPFNPVSGRGLVGVIEEVNDQSLTVTARGQLITVTPTDDARIIGGEPKAGERVHVLGKKVEDGEFEAKIIIIGRPQSFRREAPGRLKSGKSV